MRKVPAVLVALVEVVDSHPQQWVSVEPAVRRACRADILAVTARAVDITVVRAAVMVVVAEPETLRMVVFVFYLRRQVVVQASGARVARSQRIWCVRELPDMVAPEAFSVAPDGQVAMVDKAEMVETARWAALEVTVPTDRTTRMRTRFGSLPAAVVVAAAEEAAAEAVPVAIAAAEAAEEEAAAAAAQAVA